MPFEGIIVDGVAVSNASERHGVERDKPVVVAIIIIDFFIYVFIFMLIA